MNNKLKLKECQLLNSSFDEFFPCLFRNTDNILIHVDNAEDIEDFSCVKKVGKVFSCFKVYQDKTKPTVPTEQV